MKLAPAAVTTKDATRLGPLLANGLDPNQAIEDLSVPWGNTTKGASLMEIAIQANDVASFQSLRTAGASLLALGPLDRVLYSPLTEDMMAVMEDALEEKLSTNDLPINFLKPPTLDINVLARTCLARQTLNGT